jgi:hypothetical protein
MDNKPDLILLAILFFSLGFFPLWIFSRVVINKLINEIEKLRKELKQQKQNN